MTRPAGAAATEQGTIPTGSLRLDLALGTGGILRGQIIEIAGPAASGKTTLCQHILAEAQKLGGICAYIDADQTLDPAYARRCGVDIERLYVCNPLSEEQALDVTESLLGSGALAVVVVDSVTSLVPQADLERHFGESPSRAEDQLLSKALPRISRLARQSGATLILTNRRTPRLAAVYCNLAGNPFGLAIKLQASTRLDLRTLDLIRNKGRITGRRVQIRVVKHKFVPSHCTLELDIMYNEGIENTGVILDIGLQFMIITRQGSTYSFRGTLLGEGFTRAENFLRQNPALIMEIEQAIRQQLLPPGKVQVEG
jgi:recombination protein RecA